MAGTRAIPGLGSGADVERATTLLKALAHDARLEILCLLVDGERSVSDIATLLGRPQTAVSQQLMRLRADGFVSRRRAGRHIYYRLGRPEVRAIVAALQDAFCSTG